LERIKYKLSPTHTREQSIHKTNNFAQIAAPAVTCWAYTLSDRNASPALTHVNKRQNRQSPLAGHAFTQRSSEYLSTYNVPRRWLNVTFRCAARTALASHKFRPTESALDQYRLFKGLSGGLIRCGRAVYLPLPTELKPACLKRHRLR
jgi:hypothetical protein